MEWVMWIAGVGIPVLAGLFTIWWKIEARQDNKIDRLVENNKSDHNIIHKKIDRLHDKIVDLWKNRGSTDGK